MAGLVPAIHVDPRDKPGDDGLVKRLQIVEGTAMVQALRFAKTGGPEVLEWQPVDIGKPEPGQVRLRHTAVGLNYIDTYQRSGLYPMPLPSGLASEAAGMIEEVGPGVTDLKPGNPVAYPGGPLAASSQAPAIPAALPAPFPARSTDPPH